MRVSRKKFCDYNPVVVVADGVRQPPKTCTFPRKEANRETKSQMEEIFKYISLSNRYVLSVDKL
jgi:hypothetical protein